MPGGGQARRGERVQASRKKVILSLWEGLSLGGMTKLRLPIPTSAGFCGQQLHLMGSLVADSRGSVASPLVSGCQFGSQTVEPCPT